MLVTGNKALDLLVRAARQHMCIYTKHLHVQREKNHEGPRTKYHEQQVSPITTISKYIEIVPETASCLLLPMVSLFISLYHWYKEFLYILVSLEKKL